MKHEDPCGAKTRDGTPCDRPAGWGTHHRGTGRCRSHGGSSPQAEVAGAMRLAAAETRVMGVPLDVSPHVALLQCIAIAAGEVAYATERIAELEDHEALDDGRLNVWIRARHLSMDRLAHYSKLALAANVAERQVRVAEEQGRLIASAIRGILTELGVPVTEEIGPLVRKHLTMVVEG